MLLLMKKFLGIIILSLIFVNNAYSDDIYSQENRKQSEIKLNCKINQIWKVANQDGLQASAYDTSDLPKMIENPKLPGFIIETNLNSRPVWINRVAVKADENWREELSIIRFEKANTPPITSVAEIKTIPRPVTTTRSTGYNACSRALTEKRTIERSIPNWAILFSVETIPQDKE